MSKINDLTQGTILRALWIVALPLISASFVQMAYNLTDMLWLGSIGSDAVAAVGAAGFFMWLGNSISILPKTAAEISISQAVGAKEMILAEKNAHQATMIAKIVGLIYTVILVVFAPQLMSLFKFEPYIAEGAARYLQVVAPGVFLAIQNNTFSGIYNGLGNSKTPFKIIVVGLILNIVLDPLFIYGWGPIPRMESTGAAIATTLAQFVVFIIFVCNVYRKGFALGALKIFSPIRWKCVRKMLRLGGPLSLENGLFAMFSMTLSAMASAWGYQAVSTLSIGSQIEAISWMTAGGFSTALAAFVGQNYGAGNLARIREGYNVMLKFGASVGLFAGVLFFFFGGHLFSLFVSDPMTVSMGADYMKILALSQVFMIFELITLGAYNGTGHTVMPAVIGTVFTAIRIPMASVLMRLPLLGVNGIWLAITVSSIIKGVLLPLCFVRLLKKIQIGK